MTEPQRCPWAISDRSIAYHDQEWGVPLHDDHRLFEMLTLEGAQAGLAWETILKKRDGYREAFENFDPRKVARYDSKRVEKLLNNPGIVRNRLKIESTVRNAKVCLEVQAEFGSLNSYIWSFVDFKPLVNKRRSYKEVPARTLESDAMSKALLARGFKFVGPTICYAFMQAVGMVNDHQIDCFRYHDLASGSMTEALT